MTQHMVYDHSAFSTGEDPLGDIEEAESLESTERPGVQFWCLGWR